MDESLFNQRVDHTLEAIEVALEDADTDLDWDLSAGILTIECAAGSQIIINRQTPTRQIWVAARSGGYHFSYDDQEDCWRQDALELFSFLGQTLQEQCGAAIVFNPGE